MDFMSFQVFILTFFLKMKELFLLDFFILNVMSLQCKTPQNFEHVLQIH